MSSPASIDDRSSPGAAVVHTESLPPPVRPWVLWLVWGMALVSPIITATYIIFHLQLRTNFQELYENGQHLLSTWQMDSEALGYYPPSAMPAFMLFCAMPPLVSSILSCAVFALLYFLAVRVLPAEAMRVHSSQTSHAWLFLGLALGWNIAYDIIMGQVSAVPMAAVILAYAWWRRGWTWRAAAALAVGIAFKIMPGVAVLFFLIKRQWKMVAATGVLSLAFGILPNLLLFGPGGSIEGWRNYYQCVVYPKSHPVEHQGKLRWTKPATFLNPSVDITLLRWLTDYPRDRHTPFLPIVHWPQLTVQRACRVMMLALGVITFWMCRRRIGTELPESLATQYALVLSWMLLLSPHLFIYYMVWAMWPVAVMMGYTARREFLEGQSDRLNGLPVWAFVIIFFISTVSVLAGAGMHPTMLLVIWAVLLVDLLRGRFWPQPHTAKPCDSR